MKIPSTNGIPSPMGSMQQLQTPAGTTSRAGKSTASNFDHINISSDHSAGSRFQMELKSRLSREVRTATTTGALSELRAQINAGEYEIDPVAIARRMLLIEGEV